LSYGGGNERPPRHLKKKERTQKQKASPPGKTKQDKKIIFSKRGKQDKRPSQNGDLERLTKRGANRDSLRATRGGGAGTFRTKKPKPCQRVRNQISTQKPKQEEKGFLHSSGKRKHQRHPLIRRLGQITPQKEVETQL